MSLKHLKRLLNQVANIKALALRVVNLVTEVGVDLLEHVHHGQNLTVVRHESLADGIGASDKCLQDFQGDSNDFIVTCVQSS